MEDNNPYAAPESDISTPEDILEYEYVGFWARVVAAILDTVILLIILIPVSLAIYGTEFEYLDPTASSSDLLDFTLNYIFPFLFAVLFWIYKSATPGKMAINAMIVDARTMQKPSNGQLIGRYFAYFVSYVPFGLGIFWVAWDRKKQGWHDKLAKTAVVRKKHRI